MIQCLFLGCSNMVEKKPQVFSFQPDIHQTGSLTSWWPQGTQLDHFPGLLRKSMAITSYGLS